MLNINQFSNRPGRNDVLDLERLWCVAQHVTNDQNDVIFSTSFGHQLPVCISRLWDANKEKELCRLAC